MTTSTLCDVMMKYFKAVSSKPRKEKYKKNLILLVNYIPLARTHLYYLLQRKYVRENTITKDDQFYSSFKTWAKEKYPPSGMPTNSQWEALSQADMQHQYDPDIAHDSSQSFAREEEDEDFYEELMSN